MAPTVGRDALHERLVNLQHHSTVLVLWRNKLRTSEVPQRIFDAIRAVITESKVLAGKHQRALDSTVLDDAVARQPRITMLAAQIRRVRKLIPELAAASSNTCCSMTDSLLGSDRP